MSCTLQLTERIEAWINLLRDRFDCLLLLNYLGLHLFEVQLAENVNRGFYFFDILNDWEFLYPILNTRLYEFSVFCNTDLVS